MGPKGNTGPVRPMGPYGPMKPDGPIGPCGPMRPIGTIGTGRPAAAGGQAAGDRWAGGRPGRPSQIGVRRQRTWATPENKQ